MLLVQGAHSLNTHHHENLKTCCDVGFNVNIFLTSCDEVKVSDKQGGTVNISQGT